MHTAQGGVISKRILTSDSGPDVSTGGHACRRDFLKTAAGLSLPLMLGSAGSRAATSPALRAQVLSDRALCISGPDANVLVVDSGEGLIMIDGGHADWMPALHEIISGHFPGRAVRALVNTHWHPEQTGSNEMLGASGTELIAHENTRQWLGTEIWQRWSDTTFAPLPETALPGTLVDRSCPMQLADHNLYLNFLWKAHTDGDLAVLLQEENILVTGGLISNDGWPVIDWWTGGFTGGMLDGLVSLLTMPDEDTVIIPAAGEVMNTAELRQHNAMYVTVFERFHELYQESYSLEEILAEKITAEFDAQMGDPTLFLTLAFQSLQGHLRDPQNFRLLNLP